MKIARLWKIKVKQAKEIFSNPKTIGSIIIGYGAKQLQDSLGSFNDELIKTLAQGNNLLASFYGIIYGAILISVGILFYTKRKDK